MPALSKKMGTNAKSPVETALVERAMTSLLKHHEMQQEGKKPSLLGNDRGIHVQFGLDLVPERPSPKPIRILIPNSLYKISSEDGDDEGVEEPSVCLIVKEESKTWVKELLEHFPEQMKCVKKVLGLQSLRKKHGRFEQRRELVRRFDVFLADDRILPMLAKCLGKDFFSVKKQPVPIRITRKEALPYTILQSLQATFLYISSGTSLAVRAGTTGMPMEKVVENIQSVIENAVPKIPRKWANIRSIAIKTPDSMSLPIYNRTPEQLAEIARMAGVEVTAKQQQAELIKEQEEEKERETLAEEKKKRKLAAKSPLVQALKKQKKLEQDAPKSETKSKKKKGKDKEEVEPKSSTPEKKKQRKEVKAVEAKESVKVPKETKKKTPEKSPSSKSETASAPFIPSKKYTGSKKGYVFRIGKDGVGYYVDNKPVVDRAAMEALKRLSKRGGGSNRKKSKSPGKRRR